MTRSASGEHNRAQGQRPGPQQTLRRRVARVGGTLATWLSRSSRMILSFRGALWVRASAWSHLGLRTTRPITLPGWRASTTSGPLLGLRMVDGRPSVVSHSPRTCETWSATQMTFNEVWVLRTRSSMMGIESSDAYTSTRPRRIPGSRRCSPGLAQTARNWICRCTTPWRTGSRRSGRSPMFGTGPRASQRLCGPRQGRLGQAGSFIRPAGCHVGRSSLRLRSRAQGACAL